MIFRYTLIYIDSYLQYTKVQMVQFGVNGILRIEGEFVVFQWVGMFQWFKFGVCCVNRIIASEKYEDGCLLINYGRDVLIG